MPPVFKKSGARTHTESLRVVCAVCWRKQKNVSNVSDKLADLICQFSFHGYNRKNYFHPKVICDGCRRTIIDLEKVR